MRFLFIVQGEGRGHMTQAISLSQILLRNKHQLCAVLVGQNQTREIPVFFIKKIGSPVFRFSSPNFQLDSKRKGVSIFGTAWWCLKRIPGFFRSLRYMHRIIRKVNPDIIVNFFDPLAGLYAIIWRPHTKVISVAHNYLLFHPQFVPPKVNPLAMKAMLCYTRLTALGSDMLLALSFRRMPPVHKEKIVVVPPLLRAKVLDLKPSSGDFILVYVLNDGYADDIAAWHCQHPSVKILGFWDRRGASEITNIGKNLIFHKLDDVAFIDAMSHCMGLVSTAGFESICEAMYFGKPVYMVPTTHQIEQHCNALDAVHAGAGIWGYKFDLDRFLDYIPRHRTDPSEFRKWVQSAEKVIFDLLEKIIMQA